MNDSVYQQIIDSGLVSKLQKDVCRAILHHIPTGAPTSREIAYSLGVTQRDSISPRLGELKRLGVVIYAGKRR